MFGLLQFDEWLKTKGFLIESSSTNGKCSVEFLVGGIIPVVLRNMCLIIETKQ